MIYRVSQLSKQFKKDYKKLKKTDRYEMSKLQVIMELLVKKQPFSKKYFDHPLRGEWQGCRDCHIEGDWILIYEIGLNQDGLEIIIFHRTGKHSNLFR